MKLLADQTTLVTGGTRGIGKGIAVCFIEQGASVAIFGTDPERGNEVLKELQVLAKERQKVSFYQVDVGDVKQVEASVKQVYQDFGHIDILINNAGITRDNLLMRLSEDDWEKVININLKSVYNTCRAVIRPMMKAHKGKIINITSVVGLTGNSGQTNYAASKSGMIGFTKSLAKETGARNICVNCVAPGFVATDMTDALDEKQREAILGQIPMRRLGRPEDIANATLYLASPLADYVTGQVLTVDGGMVM
jgi:3-oxoacyl-[acyl-carrier protein] reductase